MKIDTRIWFACGLLIFGTPACLSQSAPPDLDSVASRYIQLTREFARHEPSLVDHWLRDPPPLAGPRRPVVALKGDLDALATDAGQAVAAATASDRSRASHLVRQIDALTLVARRLLGESPSFDEEAKLGLGLEPLALDRAALERARADLERELPGDGSLAGRVAAFRQRFQVPESAREPVLRAALDACRDATRDALPLPADESVTIAFVRGLPWDAHARYEGRHRTHIDVNGDQPLDLTRALRLACHEGYAGHHMQYIFLDDEIVDGRGWSEFALVPGFGPDLLMSEGTAEAGAELAMPAPARLEVYRNRLAPAAALPGDDLERLTRIEDWLSVLEPAIGDIARDYLDNRINAATAAARLTDEALVADADGLIMFIERRRTRLLAYAEGRRLVLARDAADGLRSLPRLLVSGPPR